MDAVLGSIIVAVISGAVTLITNAFSIKESRMHSARQSILQLILEDKVNVQEGKLPENKESILHEFDDYLKNGGNSYVHEKVDEYLAWYKKIEDKFNKEV